MQANACSHAVAMLTACNYRDHSLHIESANMHSQGISYTRLFGMDLMAAEG